MMIGPVAHSATPGLWSRYVVASAVSHGRANDVNRTGDVNHAGLMSDPADHDAPI